MKCELALQPSRGSAEIQVPRAPSGQQRGQRRGQSLMREITLFLKKIQAQHPSFRYDHGLDRATNSHDMWHVVHIAHAFSTWISASLLCNTVRIHELHLLHHHKPLGVFSEAYTERTGSSVGHIHQREVNQWWCSRKHVTNITEHFFTSRLSRWGGGSYPLGSHSKWLTKNGTITRINITALDLV